MSFHPLLLFVHVAGVVIWVGGMFFAYVCLRPAAAQVLDPPQRLPLWSATFARFLPAAAVAVLALLASGFAMLAQPGFAQAPIGWHLMLALGLLMSGVFAYVHAVLYPRLRSACAEAAWPRAAQALNGIRRLVALNLVLGILTVAAAITAR